MKAASQQMKCRNEIQISETYIFDLANKNM